MGVIASLECPALVQIHGNANFTNHAWFLAHITNTTCSNVANLTRIILLGPLDTKVGCLEYVSSL